MFQYLLLVGRGVCFDVRLREVRIAHGATRGQTTVITLRQGAIAVEDRTLQAKLKTFALPK